MKTLRKVDAYFYGKNKNPLKENEFSGLLKKRFPEMKILKMFSAGVYRVFKIKIYLENLPEAYNQFYKLLKPDDFVVCESNSLRYITKPAIFFSIKMKDSGEMKPSADELKKYADIIILSADIIRDIQEVLYS